MGDGGAQEGAVHPTFKALTYLSKLAVMKWRSAFVLNAINSVVGFVG
jgi:hypothetical protein